MKPSALAGLHWFHAQCSVFKLLLHLFSQTGRYCFLVWRFLFYEDCSIKCDWHEEWPGYEEMYLSPDCLHTNLLPVDTRLRRDLKRLLLEACRGEREGKWAMSSHWFSTLDSYLETTLSLCEAKSAITVNGLETVLFSVCCSFHATLFL